MNLDFSKPAQAGDYWVQWAHPSDEFWRYWHTSRFSLCKAGVYIERQVDRATGEKTWLVKRLLRQHPDSKILVGVPVQPIPVRSPDKLLDYQVPIVGHLMAALVAHGKALDCSDTGTGKTYMACKAAQELGYRLAVVCTKSGIGEWRRVCAYYGINPLFVINWESAKSSKFYYVRKIKDEYGPGWIFKWRIPSQVDVLLVFDEIHKANGDHTQNQALLLGAAASYRVLGLSATLTDNIHKFRGVGGMLGLFPPDKFNVWLKEMGLFRDKFERWQSLESAQDMLRLSKMIFPQFGARVRKSDVPGFPDIQNIARLYPIKNYRSQNLAYQRLLDQVQNLKGKIKQSDKLVLQLRYRQLAEMNKVDLLADLARDLVESGHHVPIFVNFTDTLQALQRRLGTDCVIHGQQKGDERRRCIDAFQADKEPFIICNVQAGGQSISLHDINGAFPRASLICPTYNAKDLYQVLGRIHRAGAKSKATNYLIYAEKTVEERVVESVNQKIKNIQALNDGDLAGKGIL